MSRNYGALKLVTAPAAEPISLAEAKAYLRVDSSADDTLIGTIITAATQQVEMYLNRKLINQTWNVFFDVFPMKQKNDWWDGTKEMALSELYAPCNDIVIPLAPLSSVTHLKTYDDDNTAYVFASTNYFVDVAGSFGRLSLKLGAVWPTTVLRATNGIEIQFVAGYGAAGTSVPAPILMAIRNQIAAMYECRGDGGAMMPSVITMLDPYRVHNT